MTGARNRCPYCGSPTTPNGHHVPTPAAFPLDAEQIVRGLGFLITLARQILAKPGEAVPPEERVTLDLGKAMGVPLPVREEAVAFLPGGATVQSGLLPYGSKPMPARLSPEVA